MSIYQKQSSQFTSEIYKSLTNLSPEFIKPFFTVKEIPYSLMDIFKIYHWHELRTMIPIQSFSEHVTHLPLSIKSSQSLLHFKTNIKALRNIEWLYEICKRS